MQAIVCEQLGDPSVLKLMELPAPIAKAGELLVRVRAAALNFPDVLTVAGQYQHKPPLPFVPGMEGAGEIAALGQDVAGLKPGQRVMFGARSGCFADYAVARAADAMVLPDDWSFAEGAAYQVGAKTAYHALVHRARLQPREVLLVHGASGGMGMAAVQLGKHLGARVIATGSDNARLEVVRDLGADFVVNYRDADFVPAVKSMTDGRGADVVFDPVGGEVLARSLRCAAFGARLLIIGFTSGGPTALQSNHVLIKGLSILGVRAGEASRRDAKIAAEYVRELPRLAAAGVMRPHISHRFPLERVQEAMTVLTDRKVVGKVVLEMA
jgi:NADPH2:quinone reductase